MSRARKAAAQHYADLTGRLSWHICSDEPIIGPTASVQSVPARSLRDFQTADGRFSFRWSASLGPDRAHRRSVHLAYRMRKAAGCRCRRSNPLSLRRLRHSSPKPVPGQTHLGAVDRGSPHANLTAVERAQTFTRIRTEARRLTARAGWRVRRCGGYTAAPRCHGLEFLIHTSYFEDEHVLGLIAGHIQGGGDATRADLRGNEAEPATQLRANLRRHIACNLMCLDRGGGCGAAVAGLVGPIVAFVEPLRRFYPR